MMILLSVVQTFADLLAGVFLLRFLMQWVRAPFSQQPAPFVLAVSNWAVLPLRRVIPGWGGFDWSCLVLTWLTQWLYLLLVASLGAMGSLSDGGLVLLALAAIIDVLRIGVYLIFGIVLLLALISWINPYAPMAPLLNLLARPFLQPFQRRIPPIGGIDISPLILLVLLQIVLGLLATAHLSLLL